MTIICRDAVYVIKAKSFTGAALIHNKNLNSTYTLKLAFGALVIEEDFTLLSHKVKEFLPKIIKAIENDDQFLGLSKWDF